DAREFVRRDRLEVRKVETQAIGSDQRALLRDVVAEHLAQRRVQQVRSRMVEDRRGATRLVDARRDEAAEREFTRGERADMAVERTGELERVLDLEAFARGADEHAMVSDLAAG